MSASASFAIAKETELRFDVEHGWTASVSLTKGSAELFGVPLVQGEHYEMGPGKFAVFTWYGAEISISETSDPGNASTTSPLSSAYTTEPDPKNSECMVSAVTLHGKLEKKREEARERGSRGPVVVIVGPTDAGKSTLTRILVAYAARRQRRPIMVDLDPGQNEISPPGSIAACTVDIDSLSVEEGISPAGAIAYFHGYASPSDSIEGFTRVTDRLAEAIEQRFALDAVGKMSGAIINTCGWVDGDGYKLHLHASRAFKADLVVVLGQDKLLNDLKKDLADMKDTQVVKHPSSGGIQARSRDYRKRSRDRRIKEYFYGPQVGGVPLSPGVGVVGFDDVVIVRIPTSQDVVTEALRPVGKEALLDPNRARVVQPTQTMQHSLLAVSYAKSLEEVTSANVAGFCHVQSLDMDTKKMTLLLPQQGTLPGKYLILGGIKWVET